MFLVLWMLATSSIPLDHLLSIAFLLFLIYFKSCYQIGSTTTTSNQSLRVVSLSQVVIADRNSSKMIRSSDRRHSYHLLSLCLLATSLLLQLDSNNRALALEQDVQVLKPVTSLLRSVVSAVTTGVPSPIEYGEAARNLVSLTWMRGFPATIPRSLPNKTMELYNRVSDRVYAVDIRRVTRKTLAELKVDVDTMLDAVEEHVRVSKDGIYTNYLEVEVNGIPLEDTLVELGTQLRAYGVDLVHYRNIAGALLGLPLMPEVASTASAAAQFIPDLSRVQAMTSGVINTGARLPGATLGAGIKLTNSTLNTIDNIIGFVPLPLPNTRTLTNPLSSLLFGSSPSSSPSAAAAPAVPSFDGVADGGSSGR